jgi:hypothetical protein
MPSFASAATSPPRRAGLFLAAVALAALGAALLLAFVSALPHHRVVAGGEARPAVTEHRPGAAADATATAPIVTPTVPHETAVTSGSGARHTATLWNLLTPWALRVDALAVLGLAPVLVLMRKSGRRRSARR